MIPQKVKREDLVSIGDETRSKRAGISKSSLGFLLRQLSTLYSDRYGSIIREISSNCYDANTANNKKDVPVIVGILNENGDKYIYFKDSGKGMNPDFIENTYMEYGESTKRESEEELGMFGIGSKSPFSIRDQYFIDSVVDGIEYSYIIFYDEEDHPRYDLISECETDKENGTIVKILIDNDQYKFETAIKEQLLYFNNIYIDIPDFNNNFNIYELENGKIHTRQYYTDLHICYDKVYYPIDFRLLGWSTIYLGIALKFNIGELEVSLTRENIKYKDHEINIIKHKIINLLGEIIDKYNKETDITYTSLTEYEDKRNNCSYLLGDLNLDMNYILDKHNTHCKELGYEEKTLIKPKFIEYEKLGLKVKDYHKLSLENLLQYFYTIIAYKENDRMSKKFVENNSWRLKDGIKLSKLRKDYSYRTNTDKLSNDINKMIFNHSYIYKRDFGTKNSKAKKKAFYEYVKDNFKRYNKSIGNCKTYLELARAFYLIIMKEVIANTTKYETIKVPEEIKQRNVIQLDDDEFLLNDLQEYLKKDRKQKFKIKEFKQNLHIVDTHEKFLEIFTSIGFNKISFYSCTKKEFDKIQKRKLIDKRMDNVLSLTDFAKHRTFSKIATGFILEKEPILKRIKDSLIFEKRNTSGGRYNYTTGVREDLVPYLEHSGKYTISTLIKYLNKDVYEDAVSIINFSEKYSIRMRDTRIDADLVPEFKENIINIAEEIGILDQTILLQLKNVKDFFEGIDLIYDVNINKDNVKYVVSYLKTMKKRLGNDHYNFLYKEYEFELYKELEEKKKYINSLKKVA